MVRNSFKFLTLALAAAITVAPVSAIDWNSGSTRVGLGIAVFGIVCAVAYQYWFSNKNVPKKNKLEDFNPKDVPGYQNIIDNINQTGGTEVNSKTVNSKGPEYKGIDNPSNVDNQSKDDAQTVTSKSENKVTPERLKKMGGKPTGVNQVDLDKKKVNLKKTSSNPNNSNTVEISTELGENLLFAKFTKNN